jgi:cytochrome P450
MRYLKDIFAECRKHPQPGMISALVEAEQDGHKLSEDELLAMVFLLLLAGHETTVHLISGGVLALLEHDEQRARLTADWSHIGSTVDEVMRYVSPVQMTKPRYARRDLELHGQKIARGEYAIALLASANCDPAEFTEPETFDILRRPNHHVGFGGGIHICLGLKLAKAEAAIAYERLWMRFPELALAVPSDQLRWVERIGMSALRELPLQLHSSRQPESPQKVAHMV